MAIKAHLQPDTGQRSDARRALRLDTSGRLADGAEANVTVHNISAAGLLIETALELAADEQFTIDLPEAGRVDAVIVWRSDQLYGCAFAKTLGPAALAAAQLRSPLGDGQSSQNRFSSPGSTPRGSPGPAFGATLNRLRRERGLTLADIASALGVSKPTVWAWEKGKAKPVPERLDAIAAVLGVSREDLAQTGHTNTTGNALIADCRQQIAAAFNLEPAAVRIMIEL